MFMPWLSRRAHTRTLTLRLFALSRCRSRHLTSGQKRPSKVAAGLEHLARNVGLTSPFAAAMNFVTRRSYTGPAGSTSNLLSTNATQKWNPSSRTRNYRLVFYQRNRDRKLRDADLAMMHLEQRLQGAMRWPNATIRGRRRGRGEWRVVRTKHHESRYPCELLSLLRDVDVLLTPHGFQSMLLLFMPQGSAIFEIFPHKYWKEGYRPFANEYGLFYGWSQNHRATSLYRNFVLSFISQEKCMHWGKCREFARHDDVVLDDAAIKVITRLALFTTGLPDPYSYRAASMAEGTI